MRCQYRFTAIIFQLLLIMYSASGHAECVKIGDQLKLKPEGDKELGGRVCWITQDSLALSGSPYGTVLYAITDVNKLYVRKIPHVPNIRTGAALGLAAGVLLLIASQASSDCQDAKAVISLFAPFYQGSGFLNWHEHDFWNYIHEIVICALGLGVLGGFIGGVIPGYMPASRDVLCPTDGDGISKRNGLLQIRLEVRL